MKGTTKIKNLGTIILENVSIDDGQIEVHLPIDDVAEQLDKVLDECTKEYKTKYNNVKSSIELNFDIRVIFSCGGFRYGNKDEAEFKLFVIVWQKSDDENGRNTAEFYEDIPVYFDTEDAKEIKRIIWHKLGEIFLNL